MRLVCPQGLFKGCLIVTHDDMLLRGNNIVVRRSMQKATAMEDVFASNHASLGVVDTFQISSGKFGERSCQLNQAFVFLLTSLAKDTVKMRRFFIDMMQNELKFIAAAAIDRALAYKLVKQQLRSWNRRDVDASTTMCYEIYSLLQAGFELSEPRVSYLLKFLQRSCLEKLKKCRIKLQDATYLVGVPDPFGTLLPHEVYISLGSGLDGSDIVIAGQVLVMRNPIYHGSEVCCMMAVSDPTLRQHCSGRTGGVIYFSIRGDKPRVDTMGGGDYDGDKYCVLYGDNPIINMVAPGAVVSDSVEELVAIPSASIVEMSDKQISLAILNSKVWLC